MGQKLKKRLLGTGVLVLLIVLLAPSLFKGGDTGPINTVVEQNMNKSAWDEFVDAFVSGIGSSETTITAKHNQTPPDIHASEVIDAYAGMIAPPIAPPHSTEANRASEPPIIPSITATTDSTPTPLSSSSSSSSSSTTDPAMSDKLEVTSEVITHTATSTDMPTAMIKHMPEAISPKKDTAIQPIAEAPSENTLSATVKETSQSPTTHDQAEAPTVFPTEIEAQVAQAAIKSTLPKQAPDVPAFVTVLDTTTETIDIQTQERTPTAAINPEPGIDPSGSLKAWTLQLATFSEESNAIKLQNALRSKGHTAYIRKTVRSNGRALFRVFVGPEVRTEELDTLKARLEKEMGLSGMVVRFKS
ncbi:MAG: SPOR domain-containing protein [Endozoicomonas sp. (ex Botrylloides leachii)]|nr:SPOR domain-containing protein [Endozoicomonas sp. (ex Botrylloides leachii)]